MAHTTTVDVRFWTEFSGVGLNLSGESVVLPAGTKVEIATYGKPHLLIENIARHVRAWVWPDMIGL